MRRRSTLANGGVVVAACLVLAVYLLRLDRIAGLVVDDAWYVLLARSLARGEGYSLVNSPAPGLLPPYPPGFAAILSVAFLVSPSFPGNVLLLKAVSIAAMLGVGLVSHRYFLSRGAPAPFAFLLTCAIVITPAFVFLATSTVMSECLFTLAQLLTVVIVERSIRGPSERRDTLAAGGLAAAAVLIRTAGIPLPIGATLYLLRSRRWRQAALFAGTVAMCLAPWWLYSRTHQPTVEQRTAHGGSHAFTYDQNFWMRSAGQPMSGTITMRQLPERARNGLFDVFGRDVAAIVIPTIFRGPFESGEEVVALGGGGLSMGIATGTVAVSFVLTGVALLGFIATVRRGPTSAEFVVPLSIGLIVLWPFWAYRFVLPLAPFLFFYLLAGIRTIAPAMPVARVALICLIGLNLADHAQYIVRSRTEMQDWPADGEEVEALLTWMAEHVTGDGYVATTNPPLVYLRTGRRTVAIDDTTANWERWRRSGVRYLVCLRPTELPPQYTPYSVLYRSARRGLWIIEI